jgi:hypothetical protein
VAVKVGSAELVAMVVVYMAAEKVAVAVGMAAAVV